jgi:hypothetical protein
VVRVALLVVAQVAQAHQIQYLELPLLTQVVVVVVLPDRVDPALVVQVVAEVEAQQARLERLELQI